MRKLFLMVPLMLGMSGERLPNTQFQYDPKLKLDIVAAGPAQTEGGAKVQELNYATLGGSRAWAYLVQSPEKLKVRPAVLFVHWFDPDAPDSNRKQFLGQAKELAKQGVTSLLVDAMWAQTNWFQKRNPDEDYDKSVLQVKELRRALDVLLAQPGVDPKRVALVGHDFGAMYGAVVAGVDSRVSAVALQAGSTSFSDWYLLGRKLEAAERQKVIDRLAPLDPVKFIGEASGPVLLQFGEKDDFVPKERAEAFAAAMKEPRAVLYYDAGHALNEKAIRDRQEWLGKQLQLK